MSPRELALRIIKLGGMRYNIGMTKYPYKQSYAETVSYTHLDVYKRQALYYPS